MYNDINYWEINNNISEVIKKEVAKKTNIISNQSSESSEEIELLSIALNLEQTEKNSKKNISNSTPNNSKVSDLKENPNKNNLDPHSVNEGEKEEKSDKIKTMNKGNAEDKENNNNKKEEEDLKNLDKVGEKEIIKDKSKYDAKVEEEKNKIYNDVNFWDIKAEAYLNEKEKEECKKDL